MGAPSELAAPREGLAGEPWLLRAQRLPAAVPIAVGLGVAGSLLALSRLLPDLPGALGERYGAARFFSIMLGSYVASTPLLVRGSLAALERIDGVRRVPARRELAVVRVRVLLAWIALGVAVHLGILRVVAFPWPLLSDPGNLPTRFGFIAVLGWLHILVFSAWQALLYQQGAVFRRLGAELPRVDLLDRAPLAPFVRVALRNAAVVLVWVAGAMLLHVDWAGDRSLAPQMLLASPLWAVIGIALFLFPLWDVHQRLAAERAHELSRVDRALRGEPGALRGSPIARDADSVRAVELIAYRAQVADFSTWPFDASSLVRLVAILGIPLLGWIGGALVERLLDAALA